MPRSVYLPKRHISLSPAWQFGQVSGRRTVDTTRSPGAKPCTPSPTASMTLSASWPMTSTYEPGGASPYSPLLISVSVPSIPTSSTRMSAMPASSRGLGSSSCCALPAFAGVPRSHAWCQSAFGPPFNTRWRSAGRQQRNARHRWRDEPSRRHAIDARKARLRQRRSQRRLAAQGEGRRKTGRPGADEEGRGQRALLELPHQESPARAQEPRDFVEARRERLVVEVLDDV